MRTWLGMLLLWPAAAFAQGIDPDRLGAQDTRFLQAALVWSGDYVGLTDGDWGDRSQAALDAAMDRTGGDALALLLPFVDEVVAGGWSTFNLDPGLTVALPTALLDPGPEEPGRLEFASPGDSLVFRVFFGSAPDAWAMHDWMLDAHAGWEEPYHSVRGDRVVTRVALDDGKAVYLRSALVDGIIISMQVMNDPWQQPRAALIASSMQWGRAPDLLPIQGGPIDRLLLAPPEPPAVAALPAPKPPPGSALPTASVPVSSMLASGTGFYVNNTDIVTAAHVIEGCRELRLEDGSALVPVAADPVLDLAVLAAARRSTHWLPLGGVEGPQLGQPVFALGFPLHGNPLTIEQGLSVTGGNVSALPRTANAQSRVSLTAPIQPGNSGGPVLAQDGSVQGVVVERADDVTVLALDGIVPQNMNFATSVAQLVPFLQGAGVLFPAAAGQEPVDLTGGIPDAVQDAVVLIGCY